MGTKLFKEYIMGKKWYKRKKLSKNHLINGLINLMEEKKHATILVRFFKKYVSWVNKAMFNNKMIKVTFMVLFLKRTIAMIKTNHLKALFMK